MNKQKSKTAILQIAGLFVCGFFVHNAFADGKPLPTVLESGSNDIIRLQKGEIPSQELVIAPLSPSNLTPSRMIATSKDTSYATQQAPTAGSVKKSSNLNAGAAVATTNRRTLSKRGLSKPIPKIDDVVEARLVTICLQNASDTDRIKAFDIQRENAPRYIAAPGEQTCAKFEPTRQTVYFWKSDDTGKLALTLSNRLDLNNSDGTKVTLSWVQD